MVYSMLSLIYLNLASNNLTGKLGLVGPNLNYLYLNDNNLNGTLTIPISKLQYLGVLNLANNKFGGSIPTELGLLSYLQILSLRSNNFKGSIPEDIMHLHHLRILDLSRNNLTGVIPSLSGNLKSLISRLNNALSTDYYVHFQPKKPMMEMVIKRIPPWISESYTYAIDLSCNNLDGNIPKDISILQGLYILNLSHNHFSDDIPANVGNMSSLESLDLSCNRLSGNIPQSLSIMDSLGVLDLSFNNLSGKIPIGTHFETLSWDGSAFLGNKLLCGFPTDKICKGENTSPPIEVEEDDQENANGTLLFYSVVGLGFVVGYWSLFFVLLLKKEKWWFGYWRFIDSIAIRIIGWIHKYG